MSIVDPPNSLADVIQQLGNVDPGRIRMWPAPGTATAADVEAIRIREERLFELVDGILVEKVTGFRESLIAMFIGRMIGNFVASANLGLVAGADGMMRLLPKTVRIPDVAFIAWDRLPDGKVPTQAVPELAPSLAVEVLSASNTPAEMSRKRTEYFQSGVDLVWEVDIDQRIVTVYSLPDSPQLLDEKAMLTGGTVLPGFEIAIADIFAELDLQQS
jgi:Uma2 family endonuclease